MTERSNPVTQAQLVDATVEFRYRCVCGTDVPLSGARPSCPSCGRVLPADFDDSFRTRTLLVRNGTEVLEASEELGTTENESLTPGTRFGHFEIVEPLGRGGMGSVYLALDTSLQRYVALKVIRNPGAGNSGGDRTTRLKQEAIAQARLNHPHVVTIYFVGEQEGLPFFAMELVSGSTLAEEAKREQLPFRRLIDVAIQVASALQHAHALDIVHGDIKPGNLLLDREGRVKLGDFGLARFQSQADSRDGTLSGTLDYLAPELLDGATPGVRSDLYALGVTLFELGYGRTNGGTSGGTLVERLHAQKHRKWEFPDSDARFPEGWHRILGRLLAANPDDRYQSYDALLMDLYALKPREIVSAGRVPRLMAFLVDIAVATFLLSVSSIPVGLLDLVDAPSPIAVLSSILLAPLGLILFAAMDVHFRKTPGRFLFQLQIVDQHGLRPRRSTMLLRHVLRMFFLWTSLGQMLPNSWLTLPIVAAGWGFLLLDGCCALLLRRARSLHDLICETEVVLDHPERRRFPRPSIRF